MTIVALIAISSEILRITPHLVTDSLKKVVLVQNKYLITFLLTKLMQSSNDQSYDTKIIAQLMLILLIIVRLIFILLLLTKMIAIKYININHVIAKIIKFTIFKKLLNSKF